MNFTLRIWRQKSPAAEGGFKEYAVSGLLPEQSFLEMLDVLNDDLAKKGQEPVAFDSDCREGICGTCGLVIEGLAHGSRLGCTTCELRLRHFKDGATITVEPFRARGFPVIKDLVVDRSAFDRIIAQGGQRGLRAGRQRGGHRQGDAREGDGCGGLHRLRRLRGRLPERVGLAVRQREGHAPGAAAAGASRADHARDQHGGADGQGRLRRLQQPRRVRGGLPEDDLGDPHRVPAPRIHARHAPARREAGRSRHGVSHAFRRSLDAEK
jgi:hypothetical protein